jgi:hypothetical protein
MTYTDPAKRYPRSLTFGKKESTIRLIVKGQGVLLFNTDLSGATTFSVYNREHTQGLQVTFDASGVQVVREYEAPLSVPLVDKNNTEGLINKSGATYWFSIDAQNKMLYAGIGEARVETVTYQYIFPDDMASKRFLESLSVITLADCIQPIRLLRDPITYSVPLLVKGSEELTMEHIAKATHMPKANLSPVAQKLYECIAGVKFVLDTPDFPEFSKAIEYSIATPGLWCHERLKAKATEFGKSNPKETYLRITLGKNNGESPGVPYVMEIWPVAHYSPIHNHGAADAIIRVLHGKINVSLFPFLSTDAVSPFAVANFDKGDVTWISPTLNQVHQLKNIGKETCITIQCYTYESDDTVHYDFFDYLDPDTGIQQFEPDSDMDFVDFKNTMRYEWERRPQAPDSVGVFTRRFLDMRKKFLGGQ